MTSQQQYLLPVEVANRWKLLLWSPHKCDLKCEFDNCTMNAMPHGERFCYRHRQLTMTEFGLDSELTISTKYICGELIYQDQTLSQCLSLVFNRTKCPRHEHPMPPVPSAPTAVPSAPTAVPSAPTDGNQTQVKHMCSYLTCFGSPSFKLNWKRCRTCKNLPWLDDIKVIFRPLCVCGSDIQLERYTYEFCGRHYSEVTVGIKCLISGCLQAPYIIYDHCGFCDDFKCKEGQSMTCLTSHLPMTKASCRCELHYMELKIRCEVPECINQGMFMIKGTAGSKTHYCAKHGAIVVQRSMSSG